ncbi:MAG: hypothetical protein COW84_04675, partial [Gammaproteobacteria bacterium CG22_combo_CG10-13_8_21_14_all_40_8]
AKPVWPDFPMNFVKYDCMDAGGRATQEPLPRGSIRLNPSKNLTQTSLPSLGSLFSDRLLVLNIFNFEIN